MSKSIFIIGAGPGIGYATAQRFGREGWKVIVASRDPRNVEAMVASLTDIAVEGVVVDATAPTKLRAALRATDERVGGLGAVLYNAARVRQQDLFSMADREVEDDLAVNVGGALHTIRATAELFGDRGGSILVTGGGLALEPHESYASLGLGKAALRNVVQAVATPLAKRNTRITIVTVATLVAPGSSEAEGVADTFWSALHAPKPAWELRYPR